MFFDYCERKGGIYIYDVGEQPLPSYGWLFGKTASQLIPYSRSGGLWGNFFHKPEDGVSLRPRILIASLSKVYFTNY